jgi:ribosomal protein S24E
MEAKIIDKKYNILFDRDELVLQMTADIKPSFQQIIDSASKAVKSDESKVAIKRTASNFGNKTFLIYANVYKTAEQKAKLETKKKRNKKQKKKK